MTNKKNYITKFKIPIIIILLLILTEFVIVGYNRFIETTDKSSSIIKTLEENCDCKTIEQSVYLSGIQFGRDGISTERGEYKLTDCNFESLDEESERILIILKEEVKNFKELDYLELEFVNKNVSQNVIIKNGIIIKSKIK